MQGRNGARAAAFWARRDVRRRWRSLVLLGVLIGLTAGFALSAWAGARRTDTALERLRQQTNAADAVVFPSQVGVAHPHWKRLADRPEVRTLAVWDLLFGSYDGQPGAIIFGSKDGTYLGKVEKPVVVQGRMFNPRSSDEVVVDENSVGQVPPVGGTFTYQFYGRNQSDQDTELPRGPKVTMHVVGVVREAPEFLFVSDGQVFVPPGFLARYGKRIQTAENADVVLRHGAADVGALRHDVDTLLVPGTPVLDTHATSRRVNTTLAVETTASVAPRRGHSLGGRHFGGSGAGSLGYNYRRRLLGAAGPWHVTQPPWSGDRVLSCRFGFGGSAGTFRGGASAFDSVPGRTRPTDRPRRGLPRGLDRHRARPRRRPRRDRSRVFSHRSRPGGRTCFAPTSRGRTRSLPSVGTCGRRAGRDDGL